MDRPTFTSSNASSLLSSSSLETIVSPRQDAPAHFILPDLLAHCAFPLSYHDNGDAVAAASVKWLDINCPDLNDKRRKALYGLQAGELTAFCYNKAISDERLRVVSDFMNYLFHLDNISDGMMTSDTEALSDSVMNALWFTEFYRPTTKSNYVQPQEESSAGKLARDFWGRCIREAGPGPQARFRETMELFFDAVSLQAKARDTSQIPDLESYIDIRRDGSGCKICWALIEYAYGIDLPDYVVEDPVIMGLNQAANDFVTWSNDIFSYNVEQSRGDSYNMIDILMKYHGYDLQGAVDKIGMLCQETIDNFVEYNKQLPPWGKEVDDMVQIYVRGLQDWIVGSLHWSYQTTRYFGTKGQEVKKNRHVKLLPVAEEQKW